MLNTLDGNYNRGILEVREQSFNFLSNKETKIYNIDFSFW